MASEREIEAAAKVIAHDSEGCGPGATPPCVPDVGPDECMCMRTARAALEAAAAVRWTRTAVPPAQGEIDAAAAAIKGMVRGMDYHAAEVASVALAAAERVREPVVFTTLDGSHRCEVNGPQHIIIEKLDANASGTQSRNARAEGVESGVESQPPKGGLSG